MTLRTDAELDAALTELAEAEGTSKQEVIRAAVLERRARMDHSTKVTDSAARQLDRWKDVIDRLGTV
ncbi:ribbon-helix-helix CopG family protein [Knoellia remsis]|uniref:Ribbon-helix-helix CopG family protein n=1 Tax=Knoellia remsis TaxID=407159 RepID=A0A2T0UCM9_9MICO|nr:CopG family transcriptional regulator [Knoellia remsis]PRY55644.1 ribbon-helix-helix CopG family protein [Knoellia remsis]